MILLTKATFLANVEIHGYIKKLHIKVELFLGSENMQRKHANIIQNIAYNPHSTYLLCL